MSYCRSLSLILFLLTNHLIFAQGIDFLKFISGKKVITSEGTQELNLIFEIKKGYHIQSNDPNGDSVIPTRISFDTSPYIKLKQPEFPKVELIYLDGVNEPLQVFSGNIMVKVPIKSKAQLQRDYSIRGVIYYQACDDNKCFYPRELEIRIVVDSDA